MKFYIAADGQIFDNEHDLPLCALRSIPSMADKKVIMRLAHDPEGNKVYIQDNSCRNSLGQFDEETWGCLDKAILALSKLGSAFPERVFGDPPGLCNKRKLSHYGTAWRELFEYVMGELGVEPPDLDVHEMSGIEQPISFDGKILKLDRARYLDHQGDTDYSKINNEIIKLILSKLPDLGDAYKIAGKMHEDKHGADVFFAFSDCGKTRIFRARKSDGTMASEEDIRLSSQLRDSNAPILLFSIEPGRRLLILHNHIPSIMSEDPQWAPLLEDLKEIGARFCECKKSEVILIFSPALRSPYKTKINRYRCVLDFIHQRIPETKNDQSINDLLVLEVPLELPSGSLAMAIKAENEEPEELKKYRILHGITIEFPLIVVDNRTSRIGSKLRDLAKAFFDLYEEVPNELNDEDAEDWIRHMFALGMPKRDILDFLTDRNDHANRARFRRMLINSQKPITTAKSNRQIKEAVMGTGLSINNWWQIGLQETLNRAQHVDRIKENEPVQESVSYNLRKLRDKQQHQTLGEQLSVQYDKNLSSQKATEQLLRESRL